MAGYRKEAQCVPENDFSCFFVSHRRNWKLIRYVALRALEKHSWFTRGTSILNRTGQFYNRSWSLSLVGLKGCTCSSCFSSCMSSGYWCVFVVSAKMLNKTVFFNDLLDISKNHDREFFLAEIHNVNNKRLQSKEFQRTPCFIVSTCQIATNEAI